MSGVLNGHVGEILFYQGEQYMCRSIPNKGDMPVITIKLEYKWRRLHVIDHTGIPKPFEYESDVGYLDDKYNPKDLIEVAEKHDFFIDEFALEMIIGRWELEALENY